MARRSRRRRTKVPSWPVRAALMAVALAVVAIALWFVIAPHDRTAADQPDADFGVTVRALAGARGAAAAAIRADDPIRKVDGAFVRTWQVAVPTRDAVSLLAAEIDQAGVARGGAVSRSAAAGGATSVRVDFGREVFEIQLTVAAPRTAERAPPAAAEVPATPTRRPTLRPGASGRLAVLLDDAGQSLDLVPVAARLPRPVGVAVLPFLPASVETAIALHRAGHEVWLHLPMEPDDYPRTSPGPGVVLVGMSEDELRTAVHAALNNLPHVVGVNNHMGSKATADLRTMTWVMQELKARGVAFLDSRTSVHTVAEDAARAQGVPTGRRHVFLDNERAAPAIRVQLDEAVYRALSEGEAVAIGHLAPVTLQVLAAELPQLAARGVTLVPPTALMR